MKAELTVNQRHHQTTLFWGFSSFADFDRLQFFPLFFFSQVPSVSLHLQPWAETVPSSLEAIRRDESAIRGETEVCSLWFQLGGIASPCCWAILKALDLSFDLEMGIPSWSLCIHFKWWISYLFAKTVCVFGRLQLHFLDHSCGLATPRFWGRLHTSADELWGISLPRRNALTLELQVQIPCYWRRSPEMFFRLVRIDLHRICSFNNWVFLIFEKLGLDMRCCSGLRTLWRVYQLLSETDHGHLTTLPGSQFWWECWKVVHVVHFFLILVEKKGERFTVCRFHCELWHFWKDHVCDAHTWFFDIVSSAGLTSLPSSNSASQQQLAAQHNSLWQLQCSWSSGRLPALRGFGTRLSPDLIEQICWSTDLEIEACRLSLELRMLAEESCHTSKWAQKTWVQIWRSWVNQGDLAWVYSWSLWASSLGLSCSGVSTSKRRSSC